jgi:hypothetical protein
MFRARVDSTTAPTLPRSRGERARAGYDVLEAIKAGFASRRRGCSGNQRRDRGNAVLLASSSLGSRTCLAGWLGEETVLRVVSISVDAFAFRRTIFQIYYVDTVNIGKDSAHA